MATVNPYLNFNGTTEKAFDFYKSVFGGEFAALQRFKEASELCGGNKVSESDGEKIMHVALPIGRGNVLMGTDNLESMGRRLAVGNNFSIALDAESEAEATHLFQELSADGRVEMPLARAFWGALFGMLTDKFGVQWMVNFDYNRQK